MRSEYQRRLEIRKAAEEQHQRTTSRLGAVRLGLAVAGAVAAWFNIWTLPASAAAFIALVIWHERIAARAALEHRAAAIYRRALARLDGDWTGAGTAGERFLDPAHPYARDLDLFGRGSAFQLINAARTTAGEETLAAWLLSPGAASAVVERQAAVSALRDALDLREDLALLGEDVQAQVDPHRMAAWAEADPVLFPRGAQAIALGLVSLSALAFGGFLFHLWSYDAILLTLLIQSGFALLMRDRVLRVLIAADAPAEELDVLAKVIARFDREPLDAGRLKHLRQQLSARGIPASRRIAQLHRLLELRDSERNQMYAPFAKLFLWSTQFAIAIERWRQQNGAYVRGWLDAVGELEVLSSLAGYASEHPEDVFPELAAEGPLFEGEGVAHPLLPPDAVRNDVRLDATLRLLLVSGSNMSGKSTLLRAIGLNTVLAWAGAPVRARKLRLSPLAVGASIRVEDSVLEGRSRFYAEIMRIRQIVGLAGAEVPLLYLLDEVLSGTNSHDRRIGAEAILRTLVERGAIGLVTTHDLALTQVAESLAPHAVNVHFEDQLTEGAISFDYRMRPGVVAKSNAIELMRSVGLEV